jgi:hypothetical protein
MAVMTDIVYDIYKTFREFALLPYIQGCSGWCQAWNCLYKTTTLPLMEYKSIKQLSDKSPEESSSVNSRKGVLIKGPSIQWLYTPNRALASSFEVS